MLTISFSQHIFLLLFYFLTPGFAGPSRGITALPSRALKRLIIFLLSKERLDAYSSEPVAALFFISLVIKDEGAVLAERGDFRFGGAGHGLLHLADKTVVSSCCPGNLLV